MPSFESRFAVSSRSDDEEMIDIDAEVSSTSTSDSSETTESKSSSNEESSSGGRHKLSETVAGKRKEHTKQHQVDKVAIFVVPMPTDKILLSWLCVKPKSASRKKSKSKQLPVDNDHEFDSTILLKSVTFNLWHEITECID